MHHNKVLYHAISTDAPKKALYYAISTDAPQ